MIKEAIQYIVGLGTSSRLSVGGQEFTTQPIHAVLAPTPAGLVVRNLTGLVDYLTTNYDDQPPVLVQVASPTTVNVYSTFNRDMKRNHLLQSVAQLPDISFENFMKTDEFNVLLQSCFVPNVDRAQLLSVVGHVTEESVRTTGDDGISQTVTAKTGIATLGNVGVPNPVLLKPYRTFVEITQPESQFVFRMKDGPRAALFEADGGAWKVEAIHSIRDYLAYKLADKIAEGKVTIIA